MTWPSFFSKKTEGKATTPKTHRDMSDVMRRVDQQIGRAVSRLSER